MFQDYSSDKSNQENPFLQEQNTEEMIEDVSKVSNSEFLFKINGENEARTHFSKAERFYTSPTQGHLSWEEYLANHHDINVSTDAIKKTPVYKQALEAYRTEYYHKTKDGEVHPQSVYGRSKSLAEKYLRKVGDKEYLETLSKQEIMAVYNEISSLDIKKRIEDKNSLILIKRNKEKIYLFHKTKYIPS